MATNTPPEPNKAEESDKPSGEMEKSNKRRPLTAMLGVNVKMLPYKLYYMCIGGATGAIIPYFGVYYKQLGLSAFQIGMLIGLKALICFVFGPVICAMADRIRHQKLCLLLSLVSFLVTTTLIGFIPSVEDMKCADVTSRNATDASFMHATNPSGRLQSTVKFPHTVAQRQQIAFSESGNLFSPKTTENMESKRDAPSIGLIDEHMRTLPDEHTRTVPHEHTRTVPEDSWNVGFKGFIPNRWYYETSSKLYDELSRYNVFITLLTITIIGDIFASAHVSLSDTAALSNLGEENFSKLGFQLVWREILATIMSLGTGAFLQMATYFWSKCGMTLVYTDYDIAFYIVIGWIVLALIVVALTFNYSNASTVKPRHSLKAVGSFLMSFYYMSILVTSFFLGSCNAVILSFLYLYLEDLGAAPLLLGISSCISFSSNVLMYLCVHTVIGAIGHIWVILCGLGGYTVRFLIYSQIHNPWFVLPGECLQGISSAAVSVALTSYFAKDVPSVSMATIQGILYAMHMGLGTGVGNIVGGVLFDMYGARTTFLLFGIASCTVLVLFFFAIRVTERPVFPEPDCDIYTELDGINAADQPSRKDSENKQT